MASLKRKGRGAVGPFYSPTIHSNPPGHIQCMAVAYTKTGQIRGKTGEDRPRKKKTLRLIEESTAVRGAKNAAITAKNPRNPPCEAERDADHRQSLAHHLLFVSGVSSKPTQHSSQGVRSCWRIRDCWSWMTRRRSAKVAVESSLARGLRWRRPVMPAWAWTWPKRMTIPPSSWISRCRR